MTSIRRTLATRMLVSLAMLALACGTLLYVGVRVALTRQFDRTLLARLGAMQSASRWDGAKVDVDYTPEAMPWYRSGPQAEFFELRAHDRGASVAGVPFGSSSLGGRTWAVTMEPDAGVENARLPDGRPGRIAVATFSPLPEEDLDLPGHEAARRHAIETSPQLVLAVGIDRSGLDATLRTLAIALGCAGAAMVVGGFLAVRASIRTGLAPLDAIGAQVAGIQADSLATRLDGQALPEELIPMRTRINELLARLDEAFDHEKRFAGAAAHELRTPVAELRALLEVSLSRPRTAEEQTATLREALEITLRSEHLVRTLLRMARSRAATASDLTAAPLGPLVRSVAARHAHAAEGRAGRLEVNIRSDAPGRADWGSLESVLDNVLTNAVEYAEPGSAVRCEVAEEGQWMVVEVRNSANGLTADDVAHFCEPFWRKDAARSPSQHLGMGLAISRGLMQGMRGRLEPRLADGEVSLRIFVPRDPEAIAPQPA